MSSTIIGYARISTGDQTHNLQVDALRSAGASKIFEDSCSGAKETRPGLDAALEYMRPGDTLIVWKLDRLGRSLAHLIQLMKHFETNRINFKSITESLDTTSHMGKLIFTIIGSIAEFERSLIVERTKAGLLAARKRGMVGGRKFTIKREEEAVFKFMYMNREIPISQIAKHFGIKSETTIYRTAKRLRLKLPQRNASVSIYGESGNEPEMVFEMEKGTKNLIPLLSGTQEE